MAEEFVSFEIAKKLKEKGYKWKCYAYYIPCARILICNQNQWRGGIFEDYLYSHNSLGKDVVGNDLIDAPTIFQVLKWMREEKELHVHIEYMFSEDSLWNCEVQRIGSYKRFHINGYFETYEQAALAGVAYCLNNLI